MTELLVGTVCFYRHYFYAQNIKAGEVSMSGPVEDMRDSITPSSRCARARAKPHEKQRVTLQRHSWFAAGYRREYHQPEGISPQARTMPPSRLESLSLYYHTHLRRALDTARLR